ncbi:MAG: SDR family oxidoreductase [Aggregatilineales bacterium]
MTYILITGTNRGIGLELVRQYAQQSDDNVIFATARTPEKATDLNALASEYDGRIHILQLDINDEASRNTALATISQHTDKLDIMINNAGINVRDDAGRKLGSLTVDAIAHNITTNAVAPLVLTQMFINMLKKGASPRIVMMSSQLGSIQNASGSGYAYRMSKAAMNMGARILSQDSATDGIITIMMHPGWVQTDMGGSGAPLTTADSALGLIRVINNLTADDNGSFLQWDGTSLPW